MGEGFERTTEENRCQEQRLHWVAAGARGRYVQAMAVPHPAGTRRRAIWWLRGGVVLFVGAYLLLPYRLTADVPIWLPFLCALAVEAQYFLGGIGRRPRPGQSGDRGPQEHDLVELSEWFDLGLPQGGKLRVGAGELTRQELSHWLALRETELAELPPGDYEVGPLRLDEAPEARPRLISAAASSARQSRPGRPRHLAVAVALALLAALLFLVPWRPGSWQRLSETKRGTAEALYSQVASGIAGHPARVRCDTGGRHVGVTQEADGLAVVGGRQAWLTPAICYTLYQVKARDIRPDNAAAGRAIAVLAHESWHLRGEASEALANCYGYQSGVAVGVELGLSQRAARALMHEQLADNPADYADAPAYIVPSGCHDGGPYDLHPASPAFP